MTTLSLLGGTWEYEFEDETVGANAVAGLRRLNRVSGGVITTNAIYSALAEAADEFQAMGFKNPMLPVTPNAYTMENQAFISRESTEYLKEGTINADWSLTASPDSDGNGVLMVGYSGGTNFVAGDIGRQVTQAGTGDTGTLLAFEQLPNGDRVAWIRPDDSTPVSGDIFDGTGALTVTGDGGTGASTASVAGVAGETQFTAIQAIGSVPTATEVYIVQDRIKLANAASSTGFQFWATDPTQSLGIISVLIRTKLNGTDIQAGDLEVFARRYGALYDNFRLNVSAGGFSALPLASSPDINNTTGYIRFTTDAGTLTPAVGDVLQEQGNTSQKFVITAISGTGPNYTIDGYAVGDLGTFLDNDVVEDIGQTGTLTLSSNETATPGGPTDTSTGGGNITVTIGTTTSDFDNTGTAEPYSITVDADAKATGIVYERLKYLTRRGQDNTFWNTVACSIPGEQWRGLEALAYFDATGVGGLVQGGDVVNNTQAGWTARSISINDPFTGEDVGQDYVTLADIQPSTITLADNDVIARDGATTNNVTVDTAGAGGAILTITSPKSSPFGTYTGTQIFGAQGVLFTNLGAGDSQNYILTDDLGTLRNPPNTISFTVTNTRAGDRILVARDTGTSGVIDKDQFGGMTVTAASATSITVAGTIDSEVPPVGVIRVVENTLQEEHRYYYSSRTTGASGTFTLKPISPSTANNTGGTTSSTLLNDSTATFQTEGVEVGMLVQDTTNTGTYEVTAVLSQTQLSIRHLYGADLIASGDAYTINETIQAYAATDDLFDLILDYEEDTGTDGVPGDISNTFVKAGGSFGTVVQVRQGKQILPFQLNQTVGQNDVSVTAVRTPDTIAV